MMLKKLRIESKIISPSVSKYVNQRGLQEKYQLHQETNIFNNWRVDNQPPNCIGMD